jgi:hypothetical protein
MRHRNIAIAFILIGILVAYSTILNYLGHKLLDLSAFFAVLVDRKVKLLLINYLLKLNYSLKN